MIQYTIDGSELYHYPLEPEEREYLFHRWLELNLDIAAWMEAKALELWERGKKVAVSYLFEAARYEGDFRAVPVPWWDRYEHRHEYSYNNSDRALFARYLLSLYPGMPVETRRSMHDKEVVAA